MNSAPGYGVAWLVASALLVALVSCGSDQGGGNRASEGTRPTAPPTTTTAPPGPPPAATGSSPCPSGVGSGPGDANQAASCLERAWKEANRPGAEVVASVDVVDSLFADRWSPPDGVLQPCAPDPRGEGMACRYEYHGTTHLFVVRPSEGGWRVTQLQRT